MKKILLTFAVLILSIGLFAQANTAHTLTADTLNGNETVNFAAVKVTGSFTTLAIQGLCTEVGGTSDGTLFPQYSVDGTSYTTITSTANFIYAYPNDTLTITDGAVLEIIISNPPAGYYRLTGTGTASDSTLVTPKFIYTK